MKIPKLTNNNINKAVAVLLEAEFQATGDQNLILAVNYNPPVYLVPSFLDAKCTENKKLVGCVEYQISDGPPGTRSTSYDVYSYQEAIELFNKICAEGWEGWK